MCKPPVAAGGGSGGRQYNIVPGDPDASILWARVDPDGDPTAECLPKMPLDMPALSAEGIVLLEGEGTWRDGKIGGRLQLELREGAIRDSTSGWSAGIWAGMKGAAEQTRPFSHADQTITL